MSFFMYCFSKIVKTHLSNCITGIQVFCLYTSKLSVKSGERIISNVSITTDWFAQKWQQNSDVSVDEFIFVPIIYFIGKVLTNLLFTFDKIIKSCYLKAEIETLVTRKMV